MPFAKGRSGNPGGRPAALREVETAARAHTPAALATLAAIAQDPAQPAAARVSAASALLDRAWGKPRQPITGEEDAPPILRDAITIRLIRPGQAA